jgi:GxxExxY protein
MAKGMVRTPLDDLTYKIIGCAMALHRELGPGLRENSYQRGLESRLEQSGLSFESQKLLEVHDQGVLVGYYVPDLIVEGKVVVELKALNGLDNSHVAQVIGYLGITGCAVGLLLDFGSRSLVCRRVFPPKDQLSRREGGQWLFVPDWLKERRREH